MSPRRRIPAAHSSEHVICVSGAAAPRIARGHPWVFREAVAGGGRGLEAGEVVEVRGPAGEPLGRGLWDPRSPIAVRLYGRELSALPDAGGLARIVEQALLKRDRLFDKGDTTAYRLCNGEGDRIPGLVLDRYGSVVVLSTDGEAMAAWVAPLAERIWPMLEPRGARSLVRRVAAPDRDEDRTEPLVGELVPGSITVLENGMAMVVDIARGQKTGAFLDQRDNRARVRRIAQGRRVLNLFSYAGGFSIAAALGGARHVTSVDVAQPVHATAQRAMRANGIDPSAHTFVSADVFSFLELARRRQTTWDLVISDPPSFAPSQKARARALGAYRRLHRACAAVLSEGGLLCASSCSSHVTLEDFVCTLDDEALGRRDLGLMGLFGLPCDHPTVPAWPEGRYLKFAMLG